MLFKVDDDKIHWDFDDNEFHKIAWKNFWRVEYCIRSPDLPLEQKRIRKLFEDEGRAVGLNIPDDPLDLLSSGDFPKDRKVKCNKEVNAFAKKFHMPIRCGEPVCLSNLIKLVISDKAPIRGMPCIEYPVKLHGFDDKRITVHIPLNISRSQAAKMVLAEFDRARLVWGYSSRSPDDSSSSSWTLNRYRIQSNKSRAIGIWLYDKSKKYGKIEAIRMFQKTDICEKLSLDTQEDSDLLFLLRKTKECISKLDCLSFSK